MSSVDKADASTFTAPAPAAPSSSNDHNTSPASAPDADDDSASKPEATTTIDEGDARGSTAKSAQVTQADDEVDTPSSSTSPSPSSSAEVEPSSALASSTSKGSMAPAGPTSTTTLRLLVTPPSSSSSTSSSKTTTSQAPSSGSAAALLAVPASSSSSPAFLLASAVSLTTTATLSDSAFTSITSVPLVSSMLSASATFETISLLTAPPPSAAPLIIATQTQFITTRRPISSTLPPLPTEPADAGVITSAQKRSHASGIITGVTLAVLCAMFAVFVLRPSWIPTCCCLRRNKAPKYNPDLKRGDSFSSKGSNSSSTLNEKSEYKHEKAHVVPVEALLSEPRLTYQPPSWRSRLKRASAFGPLRSHLPSSTSAGLAGPIMSSPASVVSGGACSFERPGARGGFPLPLHLNPAAGIQIAISTYGDDTRPSSPTSTVVFPLRAAHGGSPIGMPRTPAESVIDMQRSRTPPPPSIQGSESFPSTPSIKGMYSPGAWSAMLGTPPSAVPTSGSLIFATPVNPPHIPNIPIPDKARDASKPSPLNTCSLAKESTLASPIHMLGSPVHSIHSLAPLPTTPDSIAARNFPSPVATAPKKLASPTLPLHVAFPSPVLPMPEERPARKSSQRKRLNAAHKLLANRAKALKAIIGSPVSQESDEEDDGMSVYTYSTSPAMTVPGFSPNPSILHSPKIYTVAEAAQSPSLAPSAQTGESLGLGIVTEGGSMPFPRQLTQRSESFPITPVVGPDGLEVF